MSLTVINEACGCGIPGRERDSDSFCRSGVKNSNKSGA